MCEHHHDHDHNHPHDHGHTGLEERVAMLTYMLGHNQHHAQELHELAHDLGDSEAAQLIHDAVVDFEVGNKKLCFRLRTVSGEYFMLGSGDRPYSLITSTDTIPDTLSSRCGSAMVATYTGILPLLRIID